MVIRNMSELYCQPRLESKSYGGGIDVFPGEVDSVYCNTE